MSLAAALTDLRVDYVDGVLEVEGKSLSPDSEEVILDPRKSGRWRAHEPR